MVPATHLPSPTSPLLTLCQEFSMRTSAYDELARVQFHAGHGIRPRPWFPYGGGDYTYFPGPHGGPLVVDTTFHHGVTCVGLAAAIAALYRCLWCSRSDYQTADPAPCLQCLEVAHA